jgi:tartrate-resistant acid phosphatase type 5
MSRLILLVPVLLLTGLLAACQVESPLPTLPEARPTFSPVPTNPLPKPTVTTDPLPEPTLTIEVEEVVDYRSCLFLSNPEVQAEALLPSARADIDILEGLTYYNLSLTVNFDEGSYYGIAVIDYRNDEGLPLEELYFRLLPNGGRSYGDGELIVETSRFNGQAAHTTLSLDDTVLRLEIPTVLEPGDCARVEFDFRGRAARDFTGGGYGIHTRTGSTLTLSGWYPHLAVHDERGWSLHPVSAIGDSVFSDMAFYSVQINVDQDLVLAATGVEVDRKPEDGTYSYHFVSGPKRDFFIAMSPDYLVQTQIVQETLINSYYLPGHEEKGLEALEFGAASLEAFNNLFGRYPYRELDLVEAPLIYAAGVEFPGIVLLISRMFAPGDSGPFEVLLAHEVGHQWWYNLVGNDVFEYPWMDEALTTYSSALYMESVHGRLAYESMVAGFQITFDNLVASGRDEPVASPLSYFEDGIREDRYGPVVYRKGALFFHNLRELMGDEAFFSGIRAYFSEFKYGIAYPEDLVEIFQRYTRADIQTFFEDWLLTSNLEPGPPPISPPAVPTTTPIPSTSTPAPTPEEVVRFAVIGDFGEVGLPARSVSDLVKSWSPDFIITTGDNNYPNGAYETIDANIGQYYHEYIHPYKGIYGDGADTNRFFPSLGNHDYYTDNARPYLEYFDLPGNGRYYDFTWGPVHLFAINANYQEPDGVGRSSVQADWLRRGLASSNLPWKIVYMHHPPYSSGYQGSIDWVRWPYKEWGATAVLSGHDHTYERLLVDGFPYFVNGLGGGARYPFKDILPGSQVRFSDNHGAMLVTASSSHISFQFLTIQGELIDEYYLYFPSSYYEIQEGTRAFDSHILVR